MRFAIYARKSTESEDRQVQSLDDQIKELTQLARREGYLVVEVFQEARSAKAPRNRPEFDRMLEEVEDGRIDGVLTWAINRLSRNPVDGGRIAYLLQTGKLSMIRTFEKAYVPEDNALLLSIENGMATAYIQDLSRNVKRGLRGKFERGWFPGKAPIGYRNDFETKEIIVDPARFQLVRGAWDLLLSGDYTVAEIIRKVQESGLTSHRRGRSAVPASRNTLYRMFRDPFYMGDIVFNGETRKGLHEPMLSFEEFERAQEILERLHRGTRPRKYGFPFQGAFVCQQCGCQITGERKFKSYRGTGRSVEYIYYHCTGRRGCAKNGIRQEELAKLMESVAARLTISRHFQAWLEKTMPEAISKVVGKQEIPSVEPASSQERERKRLDALVTMRADGEIGAEEFNRARTQILDRLAQAETADRQAERRPRKLLEGGRNALRVLESSRMLGKPARIEEVAVYSKKLGTCRLSLPSPGLEVAPILQKIVAFEPLVFSSQSDETSDDLASNPNWLGFWEEVLNLIEDPEAQ